jgi:hypothetical protein
MAPKITTIIIILLLLIAGAAQHGPRGAVYVPGQTGYDVSWPNCHVSPPKQAPFGIIGVTYGKNYTKAPCLAQQATWFAHYDAYMNTGNVAYDTSHRSYTTPIKCTGRDETCAAYNYGYAAALYALKYANSQHVYPATWWLDVETENTWSSNTNQNRAALAGAVVAITHAAQAVQVGFYAYPGQWQQITAGWRPHNIAWVATGSSRASDASTACTAASFTAGPVLLAQYIQKLDRDYVCPLRSH